MARNSMQNTGDLAVSLTNRYHEYVMLDGDDHAQAFGFLDADAAASPLATAQSTRLTDALGVHFYGTANKIITFVDFTVLGGAGALTVLPSTADQARVDAVVAQRRDEQQMLREAR